MTEAISHRWNPIEELPDDPAALGNPELVSLATSWEKQLASLRGTPELSDFIQQLRREWAIETAVVEGRFSLPRGLTEQLIRDGVDAATLEAAAGVPHPDVVLGTVEDHLVALDRVTELAADVRGVSAADIKELHALATQHQVSGAPLLKGAFKRESNDRTDPDGALHQFCPPEQVSAEMDRLLELHDKHEARDVPPEVEAAWLHHRLMQIGPFQDGNGPIARALASLVFLKAGWFPLILRRDDVDRYAAAQERADAGDMKPLVDVFAFLQRRVLLEAPGVVGESLRRERVDQVIDAARRVLEERRATNTSDWPKAIEIAGGLLQVASERLALTAERMTQDLRALAPDYKFEVDHERSGGSRDFFFKWHIIENARRLDYFANLDIFRAWTRLMMRTATQDEILLSFHAVGDQADGKVVASMCYFRRDRVQRGEENLEDLTPLCDQLFEVDSQEEPYAARDRFFPWLEAGIVKGLELWRESLG